MTEAEKPEGVMPDYLTPEYWAMHTPGDECKPSSFVSLPGEELSQVKKDSEAYLSQFLGLPAKNLVRSAREGEYLDVEKEDVGTILLINIETLVFNNGIATGKNHSRVDVWGVVTSYKEDGKDKKVVALRDADGSTDSTNSKFKGFLLPELRNNHVNHVRKEVDGKLEGEYFVRFNRIGIYSNGARIREGVRDRLRLPGARKPLEPATQRI